MTALPDRGRLDIEDILARIARQREESDKFVAEQRKLIAEALKLEAERRKLDRDRWLAPWSVVATACAGLGAFMAAVAVVLKGLGVLS